MGLTSLVKKLLHQQKYSVMVLYICNFQAEHVQAIVNSVGLKICKTVGFVM